jgi:hypothetical protein
VRLAYAASREVAADLPEAAVQLLVRERLLATGAFVEGRAGYAGEATVVLGLRSSRRGPPLARAAVALSLESASGPRLRAKILAEKPVAGAEKVGAPRREALRAFLAKALADAGRLVAIQVRAEAAPTAQLVAKLQDPDRDERDQAVQVLGVRRAREAVPALLEALSDSDPEVAMHAIGALASIGDERAAPKIIELTKHKTGLFLSQLLHALGSIGGRTAEAFLWSMTEGHPDARIREEAREALGRLRRKRQAPNRR